MTQLLKHTRQDASPISYYIPGLPLLYIDTAYITSIYILQNGQHCQGHEKLDRGLWIRNML